MHCLSHTVITLFKLLAAAIERLWDVGLSNWLWCILRQCVCDVHLVPIEVFDAVCSVVLWWSLVIWQLNAVCMYVCESRSENSVGAVSREEAEKQRLRMPVRTLCVPLWWHANPQSHFHLVTSVWSHYRWPVSNKSCVVWTVFALKYMMRSSWKWSCCAEVNLHGF